MAPREDDKETLVVRIRDLEAWRHSIDTDRAVGEQKHLFMSKRFDDIESRLGKIDSHVGRLMWLIISIIIASVMGYMVSGGFNVG